MSAIIVTSTGYFGIPGAVGKQVHAVYEGKPICGTHLDPRAQYQWCAAGLHWDFLECERCRAKIAQAGGPNQILNLPDMESSTIENVRFWLRQPTRTPSACLDPQPDVVKAQVQVSFEEPEKVVARINFFYPDMSGLAIELKPDGTWNYTVGQ